MIFPRLGSARRGLAGRGKAWHGSARQYVTWYGNQDNFSTARLGKARQGRARQGSARLGNTPAGGRYHRTICGKTTNTTQMKQIKVKITGLRPLIMHNGDMVDHKNPYVVAIKRITAKGTKNMTPSDHDERDRLEWEAGLYWSEAEGAMVLPCDNIEKCLKDGAKKARLGKKFDAAVFISEPEVVIHHRRLGETKEEIYADRAFTLRKRVDLGIIRVRPMIPTGWWMTCTIEFDESVVSNDQVVDACREAGGLVGLGDWRPKFGRFAVEVI